MKVKDIIRKAIKDHPTADGLVNSWEDCWCGDDNLFACGEDFSDCELAKGRVLGEGESYDMCGSGDVVYYPVDDVVEKEIE